MSDALAAMMPPVQYAQINGIRMAYYEAGPKTGVPVVLCHGFPELAFSWRHQLKALADAGRWVIAPDQRGYGLTDRPAPVEAYDIENLTADITGLLDHLSVEKAVVAGHDWGGIVVWQMPLRHPDRTAGVIGLNTPFMPRAPVDPIAIMRERMGEEMYIVHFQKPGEADAVLAGDVEKAMNFFLRRPMPGEAPTSAGLATERKPGEPSAFALINILKAYNAEFDPRPKFLTDDELGVFVDTFERTGFTGGINWYRNFTRNWERSAAIPDKVTVPSLMIMAEKDAVLPPSAADGMEAYVADFEKTLVKDSGHWTQQEQPQAVNAAMLDWLDRRFPQ
ncbi:MAG TPA: alpha/beta hydrolase [Caulobacteraceae bacterium]|nr:alpha/beta hydrolase [Caulobacteraceae bacterium]